MTKLNIHAQSIQNPFANISSRIYFSYGLTVKGIKKNKLRKLKDRRQVVGVATGEGGCPLHHVKG